MKSVLEYEKEILSSINAWSGATVNRSEAYAVLWALMMMDKDYKLLEYLRRKRAEYRHERRHPM